MSIFVEKAKHSLLHKFKAKHTKYVPSVELTKHEVNIYYVLFKKKKLFANLACLHHANISFLGTFW